MRYCSVCTQYFSDEESFCGNCGKPLSPYEDALADAAHTSLKGQHERRAAQKGFHADSTVQVPQRASRPPQKNQQGAKSSPSVLRGTPSIPPPQSSSDESRRRLIVASLMSIMCVLAGSALLFNTFSPQKGQVTVRYTGTSIVQSLSTQGAEKMPPTHVPTPSPTPSPTPNPTPIPPTPTPVVSPTPISPQPGTVLWSANLESTSPDGMLLPDQQHWHSGYGMLSCVNSCDGNLAFTYAPQTLDYALEVKITGESQGIFCFTCGTPTIKMCIHVNDQGQQGYCASLEIYWLSVSLDTGTGHLSKSYGIYTATWKLVFHQGYVRLFMNGTPFFPNALTANTCPDAGYATIQLTDLGSFMITSARIIAA